MTLGAEPSGKLTRWMILGTGPFALEVFDWASDCPVLAGATFAGFLGDPAGPAPALRGAPAFDETAVTFDDQLAIVSAVATPAVKRALYAKLVGRGARFQTIIHPSAVVRAGQIGPGTLIAPGCVIGARVELGAAVTVNYQCGIGHEARLGDGVTLSPGVQIGGRSTLGDGVFVGLSATVIDNVKVGADAQIHAGAVVVSRVKDGLVVSGNPARRFDLG